MKNFWLVLFAITAVLPSLAFAQGSVTLTTYYPAPYGAYDRLRLVPRAALTLPCQIGTTFALSPTGALQYCADYDSNGVGELGPIMGVWTQNVNNVYLTNGAANPNLNVGIGTITPAAKFTVQNGAILAAGSTGATPVAGAGTRFMWLPAKGALRAGSLQTYTTSWDDANIGTQSVALGRDVEATGNYSVALGLLSRAWDPASVAIGEGVLASRGSGSDGHAVVIGYSSQAYGDRALALGTNSFADTSRAIAIGSCDRPVHQGDLYACAHANADPSLAMGMGFTFGSAANSVAIGYSRTTAGSWTGTWGQQSLAVGYEAKTLSNYSTAIGHSTTAGISSATPTVGEYATALGHSSRAGGTSSIAIGETANAYANYSTAIGRNVTVGVSGTPATGQSSISMGFGMTTTGSNSFGINLGTSGKTLSQNKSMAIMGLDYVGIGTTTPYATLHLDDSDTAGRTPWFGMSDAEINTSILGTPTLFGSLSDGNWQGTTPADGGFSVIGYVAENSSNLYPGGLNLMGMIGTSVATFRPAVTIDGLNMNWTLLTGNDRILEINAASSVAGSHAVVLANGNVGIGMDSGSRPTQKLHIRDVLRIEPRSTAQPTCNAAAAGSFYVDGDEGNTLCYCTGTAPWTVVAGTVCD